jgi:gliding motility-associated-like protein
MKNKSLLAVFILLGTLKFSFSQTILITDADFDSSNPLNCSTFNNPGVANFFDSGGNSANYGDNEDESITICPNLTMGSKVTLKTGTTAPFVWNIDPSDTLFVYDGPTTAAPLLGAYNSSTSAFGFTQTASWSNSSGCLTIRFKSDAAANAAGFEANVTCGNPFQPYEAHMNVFLNGAGPNILTPADTGYADICFADSVLLVANGIFHYSSDTTGTGYLQTNTNCTYTWDFTDGTTKTGRSVWFKPPNRAGYIAYLKMVDSKGQVRNLKCRIRVSTIPSFTQVLPVSDSICLGDSTMIIGGVSPGDTVGVSTNTGIFEAGGTFAGQTYLPDGSGTNYSTSINIIGFVPGQTIVNGSDIQNMCVTMEHSYLGDLEMKLTCPNGTSIDIFNSYTGTGLFPGGFGGGGTFLGQANDGPDGIPGIGWPYCFADNATWGTFATEFAAGNFTNVTTPSPGQSMSSGTYKPQQSFSALIGCPVNGQWTLTIRDNQGIDDGFIFDWGIFFNPAINPNVEYYEPVILADSWAADPTITANYDTSIVVKPTTVGPHSYTFSVTDNFGCSYDTTVTIHVIPLPTPVITGITAFCNGSSAVLTTTPSFASYSWSTGSTNDSIIVSTTGPYTVTTQSAFGCVGTSAPLSVFPFNYSLSAGGVIPYCANAPLVLNAVGTPVTGAGYHWTNGDADSVTLVNNGGPITVTLSYANGCATDTTIMVPAPMPLPTPVVLGSLLTCNNDLSTLYLASSQSYTNIIWSNGITNDTVLTNSGTYSVTVTQNGCTGTSPSVTVSNFSPIVNIVGTPAFCPGDSTSLFASVNIAFGAGYLWSTMQTSAGIMAHTTGMYHVTVSYPNGCSDADTVLISQYGQPNAGYAVSPAGATFLGNVTNFSDNSNVSGGIITGWYWNFGDSTGSVSSQQNPSHLYGGNGIFHIVHAVQSNNGCWDTLRFDYSVISELVAPNVITPNGDGKNDLLEFKNIEYFPNTSLTIFNRWGDKIYSSLDYHNDWGGGGHSDGTYYYILEGASLKEPKKGYIQIFNK